VRDVHRIFQSDALAAAASISCASRRCASASSCMAWAVSRRIRHSRSRVRTLGPRRLLERLDVAASSARLAALPVGVTSRSARSRSWYVTRSSRRGEVAPLRTPTPSISRRPSPSPYTPVCLAAARTDCRAASPGAAHPPSSAASTYRSRANEVAERSKPAISAPEKPTAARASAPERNAAAARASRHPRSRSRLL